MPNFNFSKPEIDAVTTFLEGSVDASVPARYFYQPADQRQDIIDGWWVVRKYNCMGCHRVHAAQTTIFDTLTRYQDPDWKDQKPPTLIGEGARVSPDWLMRFLNNPSLSRKRHESRRRAPISEGADAHVQLLRWRDSQAGALLRGAVLAGGAVHRRAAGSAHANRNAPWRGSCSPAKARPA